MMINKPQKPTFFLSFDSNWLSVMTDNFSDQSKCLEKFEFLSLFKAKKSTIDEINWFDICLCTEFTFWVEYVHATESVAFYCPLLTTNSTPISITGIFYIFYSKHNKMNNLKLVVKSYINFNDQFNHLILVLAADQ